MINDASRLLRVGDRARDLDKPLLFIKAGRSQSGERAARSHTGSIAGSDAAVTAAFAQHRRFLARYGLPEIDERAVSGREATIEAARAIGYPVVLKALSCDYVHKSEVGAGELGLIDDDAVSAAFDRIQRRVAAGGYAIVEFLVQQMAPPGLEMILRVRRDDQFGPIVTVGLGGALVEVIAQASSRPAPLSSARCHHSF